MGPSPTSRGACCCRGRRSRKPGVGPRLCFRFTLREVQRRPAAGRTAWFSLGRLWTSSLSFKRRCISFNGYAANAHLSGAEGLATGQAQVNVNDWASIDA
eukprot:6879253-Pyramimonas_sp.AAC.1